MRVLRRRVGAATCAVLATGLTACGGGTASFGQLDTAGLPTTGRITIDGSTTMFPYIGASAQLFRESAPQVSIEVGSTGTTAGFAMLCAKKIDIATASRPMTQAERETCAKNGIAFAELQAANDGITVIANPGLAVECLTQRQLGAVWEEGSSAGSLADVDSTLPAQALSLAGPDKGSGTFDVFTEAINGRAGSARDDYRAFANQDQIVQRVANTDGGLGFVAFSYFAANANRVRAVAVDAGDGCVTPTVQTVLDDSYRPLSRPLYVYPNNEATARPEVKAYMDFLGANQKQIAGLAGMVPLPDAP